MTSHYRRAIALIYHWYLWMLLISATMRTARTAMQASPWLGIGLGHLFELMDENSSTFWRVLKSKCPHNQLNGKVDRTTTSILLVNHGESIVSSTVFPQTRFPGFAAVSTIQSDSTDVPCRQRGRRPTWDGTRLTCTCAITCPQGGSERMLSMYFHVFPCRFRLDVIEHVRTCLKHLETVCSTSQSMESTSWDNESVRYALHISSHHLWSISMLLPSQWCVRIRTIYAPRILWYLRP